MSISRLKREKNKEIMVNKKWSYLQIRTYYLTRFKGDILLGMILFFIETKDFQGK